jgi:2-polyprenyl-3-methyl-5-hydroxy-6-metoxy-1,4-benzoquinol methylase
MNKLDSHLSAYQGEFIYEFDNQIQLNWYPQRVVSFTKSSDEVLELGIGHGITINHFSNYYKDYLVIDASLAVIDHFKESYPQNTAVIQETYFEKFESSRQFDVIIMGFIMEHVDDPDVILQYYKQFLRQGGKLFITVPNAEVMNRRLGNLAGDLPDMQLLSEHDLACGHQRYYTVQSLTDQVNRNGYHINRIEGIYLKPLSTSQMISLNLPQKYIDALCKLGVDYPELCCGILVECTL